MDVCIVCLGAAIKSSPPFGRLPGNNSELLMAAPKHTIQKAIVNGSNPEGYALQHTVAFH
jgi:hypothetical protein